MWLVVGAEGQLGRCVHDVLASESIKHTCASRNSLDITDKSSVDRFIQQSQISTIVNCAAWTAVDAAEDRELDALRINAHGAANLAHAALDSGARLIHVSTDYVFNGTSNTPYRVSTPTSPINAYGRTKLEGEKFVNTIGRGRFPIVRTAWLYSRYGNNFAKTMTVRALKGLPVRVVSDQIGQPTMALDVARLIVQVGNHPRPPEFIHGTNSGEATWYDFAVAIYELLGANRDLVSPVESTEFPTTAKRPNYSVLDHSEFADSEIDELGPWLDALREEINFIKNFVENETR